MQEAEDRTTLNAIGETYLADDDDKTHTSLSIRMNYWYCQFSFSVFILCENVKICF